MLQLLPTAPGDLGKKGEVTKFSPTLDRATTDQSDLRFYTSEDGKRTYLRVWEHPAPATPTAVTQGTARWYAVMPPQKIDDGATPATTK